MGWFKRFARWLLLVDAAQDDFERDQQIGKLVSDLSEQTERADFYASRVLQLQQDYALQGQHVLQQRADYNSLVHRLEDVAEQNAKLRRKVDRYSARLTEWAPIVKVAIVAQAWREDVEAEQRARCAKSGDAN